MSDLYGPATESMPPRPWKGRTRLALVVLLGAVPLLTAISTSSARAQTPRTIAAEFVQKKHLKILSRPLVSRGRFFFAAPDSLRWEYTTPERSLLLMRQGRVGRYVWRRGRFVPDAAFRPEAFEAVMAEMKNWLTGRAEASRMFKVVRRGSDPVRLELVPRDPRMTRFIQRVDIVFARTPGVAERVRIVESARAETVIEFIGVRVNAALPPTLFEAPR